jgi:hypothetical protein
MVHIFIGTVVANQTFFLDARRMRLPGENITRAFSKNNEVYANDQPNENRRPEPPRRLFINRRLEIEN